MQATPPKVPAVSADMETVCSQGGSTVTQSSKFFRDEMSRTRIETGNMATISDPVKGQSFVLNMPQKIAIPTIQQPAMPGMPAIPGMPAMPQAPNLAMPQIQPPPMPQAKDLGTKMIGGIKVSGKQFTLPPIPGMPKPPAMPGMPQAPAVPGAPQPPAMPGMPALPGVPKPPAMPAMPAAPGMPQLPTSEIWTSHELHLPIQTTTVNPATGTNCMTQMKNVVPGAKLPPSMFQVPPDFKVAPPLQPPTPPQAPQAPQAPPTPSLFGKK